MHLTQGYNSQMKYLKKKSQMKLTRDNVKKQGKHRVKIPEELIIKS